MRANANFQKTLDKLSEAKWDERHAYHILKKSENSLYHYYPKALVYEELPKNQLVDYRKSWNTMIQSVLKITAGPGNKLSGLITGVDQTVDKVL